MIEELKKTIEWYRDFTEGELSDITKENDKYWTGYSRGRIDLCKHLLDHVQQLQDAQKLKTKRTKND